jgi:hypothetical protein
VSEPVFLGPPPDTRPPPPPPPPPGVVVGPYLVTVDGPINGVFNYTLTPGEAFTPSSISAVWDGSGLAAPALAACSIYSPEGLLIGRVFPDTQLAIGDTAEVTYAPF